MNSLSREASSHRTSMLHHRAACRPTNAIASSGTWVIAPAWAWKHTRNDCQVRDVDAENRYKTNLDRSIRQEAPEHGGYPVGPLHRMNDAPIYYRRPDPMQTQRKDGNDRRFRTSSAHRTKEVGII